MVKNKKYILIGILLVLLLGIIAIVSVYVYKTSADYKIKTTLKEEVRYLKKKVLNLNASTYNSLESGQNKNDNKKVDTSTKKAINVNTDFKFDLDITKELDKTKNKKIFTLESILNNAEINLVTNIDNQNKYSDSKLSYKYDKEKFNANFYLQNNNLYIYSKDFFDSYISVLNEDSTNVEKYVTKLLNSGLDLEDINSLLNLVISTINDVKIKDKIISSKESVNIGNISKEAVKDTLVIDNELSSRFLTKLIANVVNSSKALSIVQKIEGSENVSDTKTKLVNIYNQIKNGKVKFLNDGRSIRMNVYMQGFIPEFLKQEIEYNLSDNINGKLSFLKYNVDGYSKHFVLEQGNNNFTLNILEQLGNKSNLQLIIKQNDNVKYIAEMSGVLSAMKVDSTYSLRTPSLNIVDGRIEYSQTFEKKKKNSTLKLSFNAANIDYGKGSIEIASEIKRLNNAKKQEIKNEENLSEIDENSKNEIKIKLLKKLPTIYSLIY